MPSEGQGKDIMVDFWKFVKWDLGQRVEQKGGRGKCLLGFMEYHASEPCPKGRALIAKGELDLCIWL
jgi:hypothetical protein